MKEEKIHIKELTPKSMSCVFGGCPGIYEFEKKLSFSEEEL